jgi:crotonobetainyl-CoA:carnitine CoA-transferase CaiB-like acyl-CoA transferase
MLPFSNLKVLELGRVLAAPWAGQMLADLGAEVIKIEDVEAGDSTRTYDIGDIPDADGNPTSDRAYFAAMNRNKKSVTVDFRKPEGREIIRELARTTDVFIENFKVGDLVRYGLDYASLRELNDRIIYLSVTGFGQTGPYRARPGMDTLAQGYSGLMGLASDPPVVSSVHVMDYAAGMNGAIAIMAALYHRDVNGGTGQHVDISLLDAGLAMISPRIAAPMIANVDRKPGPSRGYVPSGVFKTADGYVYLTMRRDDHFRAACEVIDRMDLTDDPALQDRWGRWDHKDAIMRAFSDAFLTRKTAEWVPPLSARNLITAPVNTIADMMQDEQVKARGTVRMVRHAKGADIPLIANPVRLSETPVTEYRSPPLLGEHTDQLLGERLGYDAAKLAALRKLGAI